MTDTEKNKLRFITLLKSTNRANIDKVIEWLESTDFFEAPASTIYHENYTGGLCEHSLKVFDTLEILHEEFEFDIDYKSRIIMALLHDVCKIGIYHKEKKNVKVGQNWTQVDFWKRSDDYPIGHGQKSVIMLLQQNLNLTELEVLSITGHMNGYDKSDIFDASNIYNINENSIWLHVADFIATYKDRKVIN